MKLDITNKIYNDDDAAREHIEELLWPAGPFCPHCGSFNATKLEGKAHRAGVYQCNDCRDQYSVTVNTVMERSKIRLCKWVLASHLMAASKKGVSSKQIQRMLGLTYKSAWFVTMRLREAMDDSATAGPIGGKGKIVESDESFVGGKKKNVHKGKPEPKKHAVHALVERGGQIRASHVPDVSAKTLRKAIAKHVAKGTTMNTDEAMAYHYMSKEFAAHGTVNHSQDEYVSKDGQTHIQSAEAFFAIFKRGVMGSFHSISEQHLQRYLNEFAFRWNSRSALGIEDFDRAAMLLKGAAGKRLTYRPTNAGQA